jgi:hypothetical protein
VHDLKASLRSGVRSVIDEVFSFDQADAATKHLTIGENPGKVAIKISDLSQLKRSWAARRLFFIELLSKNCCVASTMSTFK